MVFASRITPFWAVLSFVSINKWSFSVPAAGRQTQILIMLKATFSGEEAVEAAASEDLDVAVVDLKMPGIDSVETHQKLKNAQPFSKVSYQETGSAFLFPLLAKTRAKRSWFGHGPERRFLIL